jgi:hypothetical protein
MSSVFSKQAAPYLSQGRFLNAGNNLNGDAIPGGVVSAAPSGLNIPQWQQNTPGDRIILDPATAYALSNNNVGLLYTGSYRYVGTRNNSTSIAQRGRAAFWDLITSPGNYTASNYQADQAFQVTSDEAANIGVACFAGVYINNIASNNGNYWFIQESGKASCWFRGNNGNTLYGGANISGTATIGQGVYLAAVGNNNNLNCGLFDQIFNQNAGTTFSTANSGGAYNAIDNAMVRYVGVAETLPTNGNITLVDITLSRASFRWGY